MASFVDLTGEPDKASSERPKIHQKKKVIRKKVGSLTETVTQKGPAESVKGGPAESLMSTSKKRKSIPSTQPERISPPFPPTQAKTRRFQPPEITPSFSTHAPLSSPILSSEPRLPQCVSVIPYEISIDATLQGMKPGFKLGLKGGSGTLKIFGRTPVASMLTRICFPSRNWFYLSFSSPVYSQAQFDEAKKALCQMQPRNHLSQNPPRNHRNHLLEHQPSQNSLPPTTVKFVQQREVWDGQLFPWIKVESENQQAHIAAVERAKTLSWKPRLHEHLIHPAQRFTHVEGCQMYNSVAKFTKLSLCKCEAKEPLHYAAEQVKFYAMPPAASGKIPHSVLLILVTPDAEVRRIYTQYFEVARPHRDNLQQIPTVSTITSGRFGTVNEVKEFRDCADGLLQFCHYLTSINPDVITGPAIQQSISRILALANPSNMESLVQQFSRIPHLDGTHGRVVFDLITYGQRFFHSDARRTLSDLAFKSNIKYDAKLRYENPDLSDAYFREQLRIAYELYKKWGLNLLGKMAAHSGLNAVDNMYAGKRSNAILQRHAHLGHWVVATRDNLPSRDKIFGALSLPTVPGVHKRVILFDIKGSYPSMIVGHGISLNSTPGSPPVYSNNFLRSVVSSLVEARDKTEDTVEKMALKALANCIYGKLGQATGSWFVPGAAKCVVDRGKETLTALRDVALEMVPRSEALFGVFDSLALKLPAEYVTETKENATLFPNERLQHTGRDLAEKITKRLRELLKNPLVTIKVDKVFETLVLAPRKNYWWGYGFDGAADHVRLEILTKGFNGDHKDQCIWLRDIQQRCLQLFFQGGASKAQVLQWAEQELTATTEDEIPIEHLYCYYEVSEGFINNRSTEDPLHDALSQAETTYNRRLELKEIVQYLYIILKDEEQPVEEKASPKEPEVFLAVMCNYDTERMKIAFGYYATLILESVKKIFEAIPDEEASSLKNASD